MVRIHFIFLILWMVVNSLQGQSPFTCEGQVWVIEQGSDALLQMSVGSNNGIATDLVKDNIGVQVLAMGFRKTDRMLYGIHPLSHELYRIDADGNTEQIASPNVDATLAYLAGDVTTDGNYFVIIGSVDGVDKKLLTINLVSGNYEVTESSFDNSTRTVDIGFHPLTSVMFGFDAEERNFYTHNLGATTINTFSPIFYEHDISGFYFDAFGNMFGLGTAVFGSVSGLFNVDQTTGETELLATSGIIPIGDMAGCPFSVEMNNAIVPEVTLPCSDLIFQYSFANQTGADIENVLLEHELPTGYSFVQPTNVPFGGVLDISTPENLLRIENMTIPQGIHNYEVEAYVDDIPEDTYKSQTTLSNIPEEFGSTVSSNDPASPATEDSTRMVVNRIDEDSLAYNDFLCHGNSLTLDASNFGNNLSWSNGETSQQIDVFETGLFTLTASSGCAELLVTYDVVSASCPYTIEVRHVVVPDTIWGCSEVMFRYILENDSGEDRYNAIFLDTLPTGFSFLEIVNNPYESELSPNLPSNVFQLESLHLFEGIDTIDILVLSGDVPPGNITNNAVIKGLPPLLGESRNSDDPTTLAFPDFTTIFVQGVEGGSLEIDTFLCEDVDLLLDVSSFGQSFLWEDGSTEGQILAPEAGYYHVIILTGCDTADVTFHVEDAQEIQVTFPQAVHSIHQSETIELQPFIFNAGNSLTIEWNDEMTNSLSCLDCPDPTATPLSDVVYSIYVENEFCADSASVQVLVNETRRVYIPTIFSPNNDGYNDYFYLQSPDPAMMLSFQVYDRFGSLVFETNDVPLSQASVGWDGRIENVWAQSGVYVWQAEIEFFDGKKERWSGGITVIR